MSIRAVKMMWRIGCLLAMTVGLQPAALSDEASCISTAKQTNVHCWDRCGGDDSAVQSCTADCDATFEAAKKRCESGKSRNAIANTQLSGTKKGGQDGCYFGECPDDLKKRIEDVEEEPEEKPAPAPHRRRTETPREDPAPPAPSYPTAQMTQICQTPYFWCVMNQFGPVNSPCWCASPIGAANGITVPQR